MTSETIQKAVTELNEELDEVNERRLQLMDSIKHMQSMCENNGHDFKYDGHTSHETSYKCKICGYEKWD